MHTTDCHEVFRLTLYHMATKHSNYNHDQLALLYNCSFSHCLLLEVSVIFNTPPFLPWSVSEPSTSSFPACLDRPSALPFCSPGLWTTFVMASSSHCGKSCCIRLIVRLLYSLHLMFSYCSLLEVSVIFTDTGLTPH